MVYRNMVLQKDKGKETRKEMRKKILSKMLMAVIAATFFLTGCGEQTEHPEDSVQSSEVVENADENVEQGSLFSGTIFDNLVMGETTTTDIEKLLDDRILEYEYDNAPFALQGKTTITDEFCQWKAFYKYILIGSGAREDYILIDWTVELLLDEDTEYKEAVKYIQNTIDANVLEEHIPIEDDYSDDIVQGDVTYYPIEKFTMNDADVIKYIMFGKYANCDTEEAKHIIVLSVGITTEEEYYKKGKKIDVEQPIKLELPPIASNEKESSDSWLDEYQNIAFYITDGTPVNKGVPCRSTSIVSINLKTNELKIVSIPCWLYLNVWKGDRYGKYGKYSNACRNYGAQGIVNTLDSNLDMNIQDFVAIDLKTFSEFVDALGGVWFDIQSININEADNKFIMSSLEIEEPIVYNEGYQLLSGDQVAAYCWHWGKNKILDSQLSDVFIAIHEKMQTVDKATLQQAINVFCTSNVYTSIDLEIISDGMIDIGAYNYSEMGGASFPQEDMQETVNMGANGPCIVPTDLESNVVWLHRFLFGQENFEVSDTVMEYSEEIKKRAAEYKAK